MKDQRGYHVFHQQTMNSFHAGSIKTDQSWRSFSAAITTPSPSIHILPSPMDELSDLEQDPNESRNAKWYYSAFHNSAAMVGAAVLSLPYAMSEMGWGPGVAVLILAWVITLYTLWQMIEMHEMFRGRRFDRYHELGQAAFGQKLGLYIIVPQQFLVQLSVCIVFMVTGGLSLEKIYNTLRPRHCNKINARYFILIFASSEFVLSQLKNFNSLVPVSLVATIMSVSYSTIAWVDSVARETQSFAVCRRTNSYAETYDFLSGMGKMAFAYAGHNVVLEIQATIPSTPETPSTRPMWKGAFVAYLVVAVCYFPVALVGYHKFGNNICEDILETLGEPKPVIILANLFVVFHLIGTYQVYSLPAFDLIESLMTKKWHYRQTTSLRFILRSTFVAVTTGIAFALPFFGPLLGFLGGFVFAPTSYFIPCIIWLILKKPRRFSLSWWTNWVCIVAGVLLMILAPIGGLEQLIFNIQKHGIDGLIDTGCTNQT